MQNVYRLRQSQRSVDMRQVIRVVGGTKTQRQIVYKDLFKEPLGENLITEIWQTTQTGTPLGGEKFRQQIEELLGVKTGYAKRGRPKSS